MGINYLKNEILERIVKAVGDEEDLGKIITHYWSEKAEEAELDRYSSRARGLSCFSIKSINTTNIAKGMVQL